MSLYINYTDDEEHHLIILRSIDQIMSLYGYVPLDSPICGPWRYKGGICVKDFMVSTEVIEIDPSISFRHHARPLCAPIFEIKGIVCTPMTVEDLDEVFYG